MWSFPPFLSLLSDSRCGCVCRADSPQRAEDPNLLLSGPGYASYTPTLRLNGTEGDKARVSIHQRVTCLEPASK